MISYQYQAQAQPKNEMIQLSNIADLQLQTCPADEVHAGMLNDFYVRNKTHLSPWEPLREDAFFQEASALARLQHQQKEMRFGRQYSFYLIDMKKGAIHGQCTLSNIVRGHFQACHLGYALDQAMVGRGLMHDTCRHVIEYAFDVLHLHRIMANYLVENHRSAKLLQNLGFVQEGIAKDYLLIQGQWQDHILTSLINQNWKKE